MNSLIIFLQTQGTGLDLSFVRKGHPEVRESVLFYVCVRGGKERERERVM